MTRVLIIEDNADLAFGLRSNLEHEGYDVDIAAAGPAGLEIAKQQSVDLIILDVMLPQQDGFDVLRQLRTYDAATPVLMLTARGEEVDKVRGLRSGADDYVTKPFALMELLARIEALLRRGQADVSNKTCLVLHDLHIDPSSRTVHRNDTLLELAPKEFDLLLELYRHDGAVVSRAQLMQTVWGHSAVIVSRTVDTHIAELRRKLRDCNRDAPIIVTVHKAGYRLVR